MLGIHRNRYKVLDNQEAGHLRSTGLFSYMQHLKEHVQVLVSGDDRGYSCLSIQNQMEHEHACSASTQTTNKNQYKCKCIQIIGSEYTQLKENTKLIVCIE